ncbi:MAG: hypothetical protein M1814_000869 [Vezdaea aestivalis]|nr:MAG: hypothetical protein M1814_000869 [Vezdaea aestivalis]
MSGQVAVTSVPIESLPSEILYQLIQYLDRRDLANLGATSRALYTIVQRRLYSQVKLSSLLGLHLLHRAQHDTYRREGWSHTKWYTDVMGRGRKVVKASISLKQMLELNPWRSNGATLADNFSHEVMKLVRNNPNVDIDLMFTRTLCHDLPLFTPLALEGRRPKFPRVKSIKLFVGREVVDSAEDGSLGQAAEMPFSATGGVFLRRRSEKNLFQRLLSYRAFPHLEEIRLTHRLALPSRLPRFSGNLPEEDPPEQSFFDSSAGEFIESPWDFKLGLHKIKSVIIEAAPSFNSSLTETLLSYQSALSQNLVRLELYHCPVTIKDIVRLMECTLPTLEHFALAICRYNLSFDICRDAFDGAEANSPSEEYKWHLCPHLRDLGQNLKTLKLDVPRICRRLWETPEEMRMIAASGLAIGGDPEYGPAYTAEQKCPVKLRKVIEKVKADTRSRYHIEDLAILAFEIQQTEQVIQKAGTPEAEAQQAEIRERAKVELADYHRERQEEIRKSAWRRLIISWDYPCHSGEGWKQLEINADCGEEGVEWILALRDEGYETASRHMRGHRFERIALEEALSLWEDFS